MPFAFKLDPIPWVRACVPDRFNLLGLVDFVAGALLLLVVVKLYARRTPYPLPPGPKGLPFLGNVLDMPSGQEWVTFAEWGRKWGDLTSVNILGQNVIILNSARVAIEMLEKKSSIYSERPIMEMGGELVGWNKTLVLTPYGPRFRNFRRLIHQVIGSHAAMYKFDFVEEEETHRFLQLLLSDPKNFSQHVRRTAGAIILRISHGYKILDQDDPFIFNAEKAVDQFSLSTAPGGFLVNLIPQLKHVPEWLPGTGFKQTAREWAADLDRMADAPHEYVKSQMASGAAAPSFTSKLLESSELSDEEEYDIKWASASLYGGGADTTVAQVHALFLALALSPGPQARAQRELDQVVGKNRLPRMADRPNLPYINALVSELLRWFVIIPTGVPHRVAEDDVHEGYFIPKGSIIFANLWFILHDERVYHDPMEFKPERFLGPNAEPDPRNVCFGFGRRVCPGRVLGDHSVFMSAAMVLATFDVSKAQRDGKVVEPTVGQKNGTISHPFPFECSITPRSKEAVQLVLSKIGGDSE